MNDRSKQAAVYAVLVLIAALILAVAVLPPPRVAAQSSVGGGVVAPIVGGNPCVNPSAALTSSVTATSGTTAVQIVPLAAGKSIYPCSAYFGNGAGTTPTLSLEYGTGVNCGTGTTVFLAATAIPAGTAAPVILPANMFAIPAGSALCYVQTGTGPTGTLVITYVQQ